MTLYIMRGGYPGELARGGSVLGLALPTAPIYHNIEDRPLKSVPISLQFLSSPL